MTRIAVIGLVYDVAGVAILAFASIARNRGALFQQSSQMFNGEIVFKSLLLHRIDTQHGLAFLTLGFALQAFGQFGTEIRPEIAGALYLLMIFSGIFFIHRREIHSLESDRLYANLERERASQNRDNQE